MNKQIKQWIIRQLGIFFGFAIINYLSIALNFNLSMLRAGLFSAFSTRFIQCGYFKMFNFFFHQVHIDRNNWKYFACRIMIIILGKNAFCRVKKHSCLQRNSKQKLQNSVLRSTISKKSTKPNQNSNVHWLMNETIDINKRGILFETMTSSIVKHWTVILE